MSKKNQGGGVRVCLIFFKMIGALPYPWLSCKGGNGDGDVNMLMVGEYCICLHHKLNINFSASDFKS
jgi:hypothetical protein